MNINMLSDEDDNFGFYAAAHGGYGNQWPGSIIYSSTNGSDFDAIANISVPATIGRVQNTFGNFLGGNLPDELNTLEVNLSFGSLTSVDYESFVNGVNVAIVGNEIIFYRDVTPTSTGGYLITGFLRGRRGTEFAINSHTSYERVVFISSGSVLRVLDEPSFIGIERTFKAITNGLSIDSLAAVRTFTNTGAGLKPYTVVQIGGGRSITGDWQITWARRGRLSGDWVDSTDVPLNEASETYEVEIWNSARTVLKRTITGLSTSSTIYTAAQQVTDFGFAQSSITISVYQISAVVGRGYEAQKTL